MNIPERSTIRYVIDIVNDEGFGYAFIDYSDFEEVEDSEFQKLRQEYVEADKNLRNYLETFSAQ